MSGFNLPPGVSYNDVDPPEDPFEILVEHIIEGATAYDMSAVDAELAWAIGLVAWSEFTRDHHESEARRILSDLADYREPREGENEGEYHSGLEHLAYRAFQLRESGGVRGTKKDTEPCDLGPKCTTCRDGALVWGGSYTSCLDCGRGTEGDSNG